MIEHWFNLIVGILFFIGIILTLGASYDGGLYSSMFAGIWILIIGLQQIRRFNER